MADKDKPKINFSAAALAREVGDEVEEFVFMTSENKRVVFPNPYDLDADDGEEKLSRWMGGTLNGQVLKEWLDDDALDALKAEHFNVKQRAILVKHAIKYYSDSVGSLGEE